MRRFLVLALAALACLVATPTVASADQVWWKFGTLAAGARDASGAVPELRASGANADSSARKIKAGAHLPGGWTLYANFVEGWGWACHSYAGNTTLGGLIENPHTVSQGVSAIIRFYWWETPC